MVNNIRRGIFAAIGLCSWLSMQQAIADDTSATSQPAELYFFAPPPEFKSAGKRVGEDAVLQAALDKSVGAALTAGDVKYLETTASALSQEKKPTPRGRLRLELFSYAVQNSIKEGSDERTKIDLQKWSSALETVSNWSKQYPRSPFAPVTLAQLRLYRAQSLRGEGFADSVAHEQWAMLNKEVSKAHEILEECSSFAKANPLWYEALHEVATFSSIKQKDYLSIIEESLKVHPEYLGIAEYGVDYMLPRWGGSDKAVRDYINRVTSLVSRDDSILLYARIYRRLLRFNFYDYNTVVTLAGADLKQLKLDDEEILRRYPDAYNEDAEAAMLCTIGDKEGLKRALVKISDSPILKAWSIDGKSNYYLACRRFVNQ